MACQEPGGTAEVSSRPASKDFPCITHITAWALPLVTKRLGTAVLKDTRSLVMVLFHLFVQYKTTGQELQTKPKYAENLECHKHPALPAAWRAGLAPVDYRHRLVVRQLNWLHKAVQPPNGCDPPWVSFSLSTKWKYLYLDFLKFRKSKYVFFYVVDQIYIVVSA